VFQDFFGNVERRVELRNQRRRDGMGEPAEEWEMGRTRQKTMFT
jgi:hypothetical protein